MARKFAKIKPNIWRSSKFRQMSAEAKLLGIYLMTNDYFQMVGIYRLPRYFMSKDTSLDQVSSEKALNELIALDFCQYDDDSEFIWVVDMALSQVADNPNAKQLKGAKDELARLHEDECPFVETFVEKYSVVFSLPSAEELCYG